MMMTSSKKTTIGALAGPPEQPVPITAHPLEYRIERQHLDTRKNIPWSSYIKRAAAKFWLTKFNTQHIGTAVSSDGGTSNERQSKERVFQTHEVGDDREGLHYLPPFPPPFFALLQGNDWELAPSDRTRNLR